MAVVLVLVRRRQLNVVMGEVGEVVLNVVVGEVGEVVVAVGKVLKRRSNSDLCSHAMPMPPLFALIIFPRW